MGLCLCVEKGWSGKDVQRTHMRMGRHKRTWPAFSLPRERGSMTAVEVLQAPAGMERARAIRAWCESVWAAYADSRRAVADLLREYDIV